MTCLSNDRKPHWFVGGARAQRFLFWGDSKTSFPSALGMKADTPRVASEFVMMQSSISDALGKQDFFERRTWNPKNLKNFESRDG